MSTSAERIAELENEKTSMLLTIARLETRALALTTALQESRDLIGDAARLLRTGTLERPPGLGTFVLKENLE